MDLTGSNDRPAQRKSNCCNELIKRTSLRNLASSKRILLLSHGAQRWLMTFECWLRSQTKCPSHVLGREMAAAKGADSEEDELEISRGENSVGEANRVHLRIVQQGTLHVEGLLDSRGNDPMVSTSGGWSLSPQAERT